MARAETFIHIKLFQIFSKEDIVVSADGTVQVFILWGAGGGVLGEHTAHGERWDQWWLYIEPH